jgi:hypothetical protein
MKDMEEPIGENTSLLATLLFLVENEKPVLVRYPYVTDARHVASKISGTRSWVEALKKFASYPVAIASYQAPLVNDLDSLRAAVASVGAAFYRGALYGPVDVLDLFWDEYTSCELPVSDFAFKAHRYSPYADVLRATASFQDYPAILVGEDGALLPVSVLRALFDYYLHVGKEPSRLVRDLAVPAPILDPEASVAEAARLVRRFGLVVLPGDRAVTASELLLAPLAMRLSRFFV